jgi:predicted Zn-dependent peptidase
VYIPKQHLQIAIDILADIIKNPTFKEFTLKKEKNVVLNEILMVNDDPKQYQWVIFLNTLFKKSPAKNPVYGNVEAIKKMTREDILSYYQKYYTPENMTISLTGNLDDPLPLLNTAFGSLPHQSVKKEQHQQEPQPTKPTKKKVKMEVEHSYLVMGYQAPPKGHQDYYTLEVIRSILGRGQSSRLFEEIRTKRGIAYIVGCMYESSYSFGALANYVGTEKKNLEEARKVLKEAFQLKDLTDKEVEDAKQYLIGSFILRKEDNKERADMNAEWSLLEKDPQHYIQSIQRVTKQQVLQTAKRYFHNNITEILLQK